MFHDASVKRSSKQLLIQHINIIEHYTSELAADKRERQKSGEGGQNRFPSKNSFKTPETM